MKWPHLRGTTGLPAEPSLPAWSPPRGVVPLLRLIQCCAPRGPQDGPCPFFGNGVPEPKASFFFSLFFFPLFFFFTFIFFSLIFSPFRLFVFSVALSSLDAADKTTRPSLAAAKTHVFLSLLRRSSSCCCCCHWCCRAEPP